MWASAFSPDGALLATASQGGNIDLWQLPTGAFLGGTVWEGSKGLPAIAFTRDGGRIVVGNASGDTLVLRVPNQKPPPPLPLPALATVPPRTLPVGASLADRARALVNSYAGDRAVLTQAQALCEQALAANPRDAEALVQRARVKRSLGMYTAQHYDLRSLDAADEDLDAALAIDPRNKRALVFREWVAFSRAMTISTQKRVKPDFAQLEAAIEAVDALSLDDFDVDELHFELAVREERFDEAQKLAIRRVENARDTTDVRAGYSDLANVYTKMGWFRAADAAWRKSLELDPGGAWKRGDYASFQLRVGDTVGALESINVALSKLDYGIGRSTRAEVRVDNAIWALWDRRDAVNAKTELEAALEDDPDSADARYGLVALDWFVATGKGQKCDDCVDRLRAIAKHHPEHAATKRTLATLGQK